MLDIKITDGKLKIKGTFDLGYMGKYVNHDYNDTTIEILEELSEVKDWDCIKSASDTDIISDDDTAKLLTEYFNNFEKKIQQNIKQVNDNFLFNIFAEMEACGYPFWEIEEITNKNSMPETMHKQNKEASDYWENVIYEPLCDMMTEIENEYIDSPNDGSMKKTDFESVLRKILPMFNIDKLLACVTAECLTLSDGNIAFQCSDSVGFEILCSAYDCLDEKLCFTDWHNH